MKRAIAERVKLYLDDDNNPIWRYLKTQFKVGKEFNPIWAYLKTQFKAGKELLSGSKTKNFSITPNYRDEYRKRISQSKSFFTYPYPLSSATTIKSRKTSQSKLTTVKRQKGDSKADKDIIYLAGWSTLKSAQISKEMTLVVHLQTLPPKNYDTKLYKQIFEKASYIFVSTFVLKDFIMTTFDLNPYKIIVFKFAFENQLSKPVCLSHQHHVFVLGDFENVKLALNQLTNNFSRTYKLVFVANLDRLKKAIQINGIDCLFLDHLDANTWHRFHREGRVYTLNLNTLKLKQLDFQDFKFLNLNLMYDNLLYYFSQIV